MRRVLTASRVEFVGRAVLALAGGGALALAYPRPDWSGAAWVALAPIIVIALLGPPRTAFAFGWAAGALCFLVLLRWLDFTIRVYSAVPWPLTWLPIALLATYLGLYVGLFAMALAWLARRSAPRALCAAPFLWVAGEWIRGALMGGFPWGLLGYSQYRHLEVIQIAELGGVYAVSFVVLAVNAALAGWAVLGRRHAVLGTGLALALLGGTLAFGAARLGAPQPEAEVTVAVMQPAIEQPLKFDPNHVGSTLRIYGDLTRQAVSDRPDLVVWPETASPTVLRRDPGLLGDLQALSAQAGVPLLVGSVDVDATGQDVRNTAFLLTDRGIVNRYDKIHLVPFGEYVPLAGVIGFVRGWAEFIAELTPGSRPVVFSGPPAPFGVVICYEGVFPELVRRFVRGGARFLVNMTNDAWFGRTSGPLQHLAMYTLRAVEHRTAVVRAANTGVSGFIEPTGRIARSMDLYERGILAARIPLRDRVTLYTRFGDWVAWIGLLASGAFLGATALTGAR